MYERYAVYYTPQGALAERGAAWLGWDVASGTAVAHPVIDGVDAAQVTQTPRKYGLHGTIKPPMVLAQGRTEAGLRADLAALCDGIAPARMETLALRNLDGFLALTPLGDTGPLAALAASIVRGLDAYRAPASQAELERRRKQPLNAAQEQHLVDWGYPYVTDQFRFHITLTGRLPNPEASRIADALRPHFAPVLPAPFVVSSLTLAGQDRDGMFHALDRYDLTG